MNLNTRPIEKLELSRFEPPKIQGEPNCLIKSIWYLVNAIIFQSSIPALLPSSAKAAILRAFGARVGRGVVVKPRVTIKAPWFLEMGTHVWLGERVWIDNHTTVRLGSNVCVSQGVYLFTGNHDWSDPRFRFFCRPVEVGNGAWITAFQMIGPGTVVPPHVVVLPDTAKGEMT